MKRFTHKDLWLAMILMATAAYSQALTYSEVPGSPYAVGNFPCSMAMSTLGEELFVLNGSDSSISAFLVKGPTLVPVAGMPFTVSSDASAIAADSDFVYVANAATAGSVSVFTIGANGSLTEVTGSPFSSGGSYSQQLEVTPNQSFLIVTNSLSDDFGVLEINRSTGALTAVAGSPFSAEDGPYGIAVDPTSSRLIIANSADYSFSVYLFDPTTGIPSEVAGSPVSYGDSPRSMDFDPSGSYLYVYSLNSFNGFSVALDGTLTELPNSPYPPSGFTGYNSVSVSADGTNVFSTGDDWVADVQYLVVFDVGVNGDLTPASYSPIELERNSYLVLAHPMDDLLILSDVVDDSITVMAPLVLSGLGSATVDGVESTEEWVGASTRSLTLNLADGSTTAATLGVMNDQSTLFLGLWVPAGISSGTMTTGFEFDSDSDGFCADGDDAIFIVNGTFWDQYRHGGCILIDNDTDDGGAVDGAGAVDSLNTFFEHSHPLSSGDTGHDFDLAPGDSISFFFFFTHCSTTTCTTTYYPGDGKDYDVGIYIVDDGGIFRDGFENGTLSAWSKSVAK